MKTNPAGIYIPNAPTPAGQAQLNLFECGHHYGVSAAFVVEVIEHVEGGTLVVTTTGTPVHVSQSYDEVNEALAKATE